MGKKTQKNKKPTSKIPELTILMPCLNEEETLEACIDEAKEFISQSKVNAEILVADNGSADDSIRIAEKNGARVVSVSKKGYGNALIGGITSAAGRYIIMGDCDGSYDFKNIAPFLDALRHGASLAVGNRFAGMQVGAMPFWHKYFGVPFLSWLGRIKYRCQISDFHCGLRGINKSIFKKLNLQCGGMEFATEMIAKASRFGCTIVEIPVFYRCDGRNGKSHLHTLRDGFRHLIYIIKN